MLAPLMGLILVLGVYPKPVIDTIRPTVNSTLQQIHQPDPAPTYPVAPVAESGGGP